MKLSKGFIYTFLAALSWAVSIVIARFVLRNGENAYNVAFLTTVLASPYWLYVFSKRTKELEKATRNDYFILLGMGLISTIGVSIVEAFALKYSPAVNYSFLIRSVILFTMPLLKETMTPIQILGGFLIILAGIFVEKLKI